jgi:hypothetical protein
VTRKVLVALSIGKYEDEVLCDVVRMHACHLLLGRPWQYDRRAMHDGLTNKYSFTLNRQPITLVPLTPKQAREDQLKLQRSNEKKREKERKAEIEKNGEKNIDQSVKEKESTSALPGEYGVSASFNVADLCPFDVGDDLRANPSQEGENDASQGAGHANHTHGNGAEFAQDPLSLPSGPITRLRAKRFKEALNGQIQ